MELGIGFKSTWYPNCCIYDAHFAKVEIFALFLQLTHAVLCDHIGSTLLVKFKINNHQLMPLTLMLMIDPN